MKPDKGRYDWEDDDIVVLDRDWEERGVGLLKHGEHDQSTHGSWSEGREEEPKGEERGEGEPPAPSAEAMAVGGDEWNKQTAERLEREYVEAQPKIDKIVSDAIATAEAEGPPVRHELGDAPSVPDWWGAMSENQQEAVFNEWKSYTFDSYQQSEIDSWYENSRTDDAGNQLAYDFEKGLNEQWAFDAIEEARTVLEDKEIPFTNTQLLQALEVSYEGGWNTIDKGLKLGFDDEKLGKPAGWQEGQETFPGIEPQNPASALTKEMRETLIAEMATTFEKAAENVSVEPPDYINESVTEMQDMSWGEMDDSEKFSWASSHSDVMKDMKDEYDEYFGSDKQGGGTGQFYMPEKLDPLQAGSGSPSGYTATQIVAKHVSIERASQIMVERKIYDSIEKARVDAKRMDNTLWEGWKGSSSGIEGQLLQKATADELGGRLNEMMVTLDPSSVPGYAPNAAPGKSYDAVKAYVRGKWETSQFLLKKAGLETVNVYRTVNIPDAAPPTILGPGANGDYRVTAIKTFDDLSVANRYMEDRAAEHGKGYSGSVAEVHNVHRVFSKYEFPTKTQAETFVAKYVADPANPEQHREKVDIPAALFERLPDIHVDRNGAASATTDRAVANKWDGGDGRVVLRASVPRTAVVSVPAYGINVQGEHEVVIAGTAWKSWSAWHGKAPAFEDFPEVKGTGIVQ